MKDFILLKGGDYTINAFADIMEAFNNNQEDQEYSETLHYYTTSNVALHLHRNISSKDTEKPLAIAQFMVDPRFPPDDPNLYRALDMDLMKKAAREYGLVLFALITNQELLPDFRLINEGIFVVRDSNGRLINYETGEFVFNNQERVTTITFFSLTKLETLPVYYLITDPHIVTIGDGYDFEHDNTIYREFTDHDGTLKEAIFTPVVDENSVMVNNTIFAKDDIVEISLFTHPHNIFKISGVSADLADINMEVESNFDVEFSDNMLKIKVNSDVGYVKATPKLGHFCEMSNFENTSLEFVIHKI